VRGLPSGTDVIVTYESKYGDISTLFVLPNGVALVADFKGDNIGPGTVDALHNDTLALQREFPGTKVLSSTFDAFFDVANQPEIKAKLPVVTQEIGDGWLYGIPSDPLKQAMFKEVARQRAACVQSGECDPTSAGMAAFDRLLVKAPEHTAGVASQVFMGDYANWSNSQFDAARAVGRAQGFYNGSAKHGDYNTSVESWREQRTYITNAHKLIAAEHPALAKSIASALEALQYVGKPSTAHLHKVPQHAGATFKCAGATIGFDAHGAVTTPQDADEKAWADAAHPVGLYSYRTFDNEDYNRFLQDFTARVNGSAYRACPGRPTTAAAATSASRT